ADPSPPETLRLRLSEILRLDAEMDASAAAADVRLKPGVLSPNGIVVAGLDGSFFISNGANRWERQFLGELTVAPSWIEAWQALLAGRQATAAARGVVLWNVVVPEKQVVLPEHRWPAPFPDGERRPLRHLQTQLSADARLYYAADALLAAKAHGPVYFRRNSHWTPFGCCLAALGLAAQMGLAVDPEALEFGYRRTRSAHDLPPHIFEAPQSEDAGELAPLNGYVFEERTRPITGRFTGSRYGIRNPAAPDLRRLIIFGDSFSYDAGFAAALSAIFAEVVFVWSASVIWDEVAARRADVVVWQNAERFLATVPAA
ncbi:MAG: hypothetical protein JWQ97_2424, partial [Phenylobacterium sp.]|nr:hypothetical protein [Phenylobacterium sp.]